jgi:thioredoxin reductase (NADPH)
MKLMDQQTDVLIIGAGPIGIEMAVALKRAGIDYQHVEARQIGWMIASFPPQTRFFSSAERIAIAGVPLQIVDQAKPSREEYLAYLRAVVQQFDLSIRTFEPVTSIRRDGAGFVVETAPLPGRRTIRAKRVICATGGTARPRNLGIAGEDLPHVTSHLGDPHHHFRRRVLVVGGKNSAVESALRLYRVGATVVMSYRRSEFNPKSIKYWLLPEIRSLIESGKIEAHFDTMPAQIHPNRVTLRSTRDGSTRDIPADVVLLQIGYEADMSLLRGAGVELTGPGERPTFNPETMETNVPGLYVAGTATGGTQEKFELFIENSHVHVERILAALQHRPAHADAPTFAQPES